MESRIPHPVCYGRYAVFKTPRPICSHWVQRTRAEERLLYRNEGLVGPEMGTHFYGRRLVPAEHHQAPYSAKDSCPRSGCKSPEGDLFQPDHCLHPRGSEGETSPWPHGIYHNEPLAERGVQGSSPCNPGEADDKA